MAKTKPQIQYALISVSDKSGLVDFAEQLTRLGIEIIATGGTAQQLQQNGIKVSSVSDYTQFPEIMGGRVKTLHPAIHGGLLGRRGIDDKVMQEHHIPQIDLLVVNLYPFQQTIAQPNCTEQDAIENIDIGGPAMLRAGAKNHQDVTVVVDPQDYDDVLESIKTEGNTTLHQRRRLAQKAFAHTANYDQAIASYLAALQSSNSVTPFPAHYTPHYEKRMDLRYGENPHQQAAFYTNSSKIPGSLAEAKLLQGKPLSFNNMIDSDTALTCVRTLSKQSPACVIVKHATPCGAAIGESILDAYQKAYATDPLSAFGGIIAINRSLDKQTAETILQQQFVEVILAPAIEQNALPILAEKQSLRVLACGSAPSTYNHITLHSISGGLLVQQVDRAIITSSELNVVSKRQPTAQEITDAMFAWQVVRFVKSNAIVYAKNHCTLGIGTGQTSRVFSAKIALQKAEEAGLALLGAVMASDAFFPFTDSIEVAAKAGITCVIQPGGSKHDADIIEAANKANMSMIMTGIRHFRH